MVPSDVSSSGTDAIAISEDEGILLASYSD